MFFFSVIGAIQMRYDDDDDDRDCPMQGRTRGTPKCALDSLEVAKLCQADCRN